MGKSKKKDPSKKLALQAKKDAKADKAARKRLKKEANKEEAPDDDDDDDDGLLLDSKHNINNPSLDDLLQVYRKRDVEGSRPIVETLEGFPPPRGNFSMTVVEEQQKGGKQEVYIFGGEYFDGVENIVVDHLLKWTYTSKSSSSSDNHEWRQIVMPSSAPTPPARCAHSTVYYNGALYVFGGELATADHYHHYKDLWRYDIKQQSWTELTSRTGSVPSARSGHSAIVWKRYMILFGGFYEAMRDTPRWFNDVFVFDLQTQQWMDVPYSKLGNRPEPRSACNIAILNDDVVLHGGFSKLTSTAAAGGKETKVHTDAWLLHLKPILQGKPPTWEKLLSSTGGGSNARTSLLSEITNTRNPNGRSAAASATYKNKMLVFGGVVDAELMHHKVDSVFFNDLFCLDVEPKPRWFPLKVRQQPQQQQQTTTNDDGTKKEAVSDSAEKASATQDNDDDDGSDEGDNMVLVEEEQDADDDDDNKQNGWNIDQLRENMFAFVDGAGNIVYERLDKEAGGTDPPTTKLVSDDDDNNESEEEKEETKEEEKEEDDEKEEESDDDHGQKHAANKSSSKRSSNKKVQLVDTSKLQSGSSKVITSSSVMKLDPETKTPEAVQRDEPLPRIKCGAIVNRNTLFIYGGLVEIGDREVTLDDMWSLDLRKRDKWKCLWPGTMHKQVWRGAVHDDDDSYISTGADNDSDDDDDSDEDEEEKNDNKDSHGQSQELADLSAQHDLDNEMRTPQNGEVLADFYSRTKGHWNDQAMEVLKDAGETAEPSKKDLKREGFQLARKRYEELEPVMQRLKELGLRAPEASSGKSQKKSKKKK